MEIKIAGKQVSFDEFSKLYPKESSWLGNDEAYSEVILNIADKWSIELKNQSFSPISLGVERDLDYHMRYFYKNSIYKENLAKALGHKKGTTLVVADLTAGMLGDTALMLAMGLEVVAFERNPLMACLIEQESHPKLSFNFGQYIDQHVDVLYFDPMYEQKNEKTAPKKEMQFLRQTVGVDSDAKEFAQKMRSLGKKLVIKRSKKADPLLENPHHQVTGKSTCYDVY